MDEEQRSGRSCAGLPVLHNEVEDFSRSFSTLFVMVLLLHIKLVCEGLRIFVTLCLCFCEMQQDFYPVVWWRAVHCSPSTRGISHEFRSGIPESGEEKTEESLHVKQFLEQMANVEKLSGSLKQTAALG